MDETFGIRLPLFTFEFLMPGEQYFSFIPHTNRRIKCLESKEATGGIDH